MTKLAFVVFCIVIYVQLLVAVEGEVGQRLLPSVLNFVSGRRNPSDLRDILTRRRPHPCEGSHCYPASGSLLVGREANITASSTCGLKAVETYCIATADDTKKCFRCDSRDQFNSNPGLSHRVDQIINRFYSGTQMRSWWQSANGEENVSIRIDLDALFQFTHLIMTFKSVRPAAMFFERSTDFGKTWKVYKYFAHNCAESFPGIYEGTPRTVTEVTCESRYNAPLPSTEGEVIFRVLPRNIQIPNPYSNEVQQQLKITNLRINFNKFHSSLEDKEKYYAIYELIVRGSCSCNGHSSKCLPIEPRTTDEEGQDNDMIHGRCECRHNTKGANCEMCDDLYNDREWAPVMDDFECKKCNCNNHASSCHFDSEVFKASGDVSGGVCDNCQHNTAGINCEECADFYFRRADKSITDIDACQACDCNPNGSQFGGRCDSIHDQKPKESGHCYCKENITGAKCDRCVAGYNNFPSCNIPEYSSVDADSKYNFWNLFN